MFTLYHKHDVIYRAPTTPYAYYVPVEERHSDHLKRVAFALKLSDLIAGQKNIIYIDETTFQGKIEQISVIMFRWMGSQQKTMAKQIQLVFSAYCAH